MEDQDPPIGGNNGETAKSLLMAWWNGGGKLIPRMEANPELQKFLATRPAIFAYGEAQVTTKTKKIRINGYTTIIHSAQKEGRRRGIVVYYKNKHNQVITKDAFSKKFDILT